MALQWPDVLCCASGSACSVETRTSKVSAATTASVDSVRRARSVEGNPGTAILRRGRRDGRAGLIATATYFTFDILDSRWDPNDVLDAHSADTAVYRNLFDSEGNRLDELTLGGSCSRLVIMDPVSVDRDWRDPRFGPFLAARWQRRPHADRFRRRHRATRYQSEGTRRRPARPTHVPPARRSGGLRTHLEQFSARPADARVFTSTTGSHLDVAHLHQRARSAPGNSPSLRATGCTTSAATPSGPWPSPAGSGPASRCAPPPVGVAGRTSPRCSAGTSPASRVTTSWRQGDLQCRLVSTSSADGHRTSGDATDQARQPASRRRTSATSAARRSASARPSSLATAAR